MSKQKHNAYKLVEKRSKILKQCDDRHWDSDANSITPLTQMQIFPFCLSQYLYKFRMVYISHSAN